MLFEMKIQLLCVLVSHFYHCTQNEEILNGKRHFCVVFALTGSYSFGGALGPCQTPKMVLFVKIAKG